MQRGDWVWIGLFAIVTLVLFIPMSGNEFVLDAEVIVRDNSRVSEHDFGAAFTTDWWNRDDDTAPRTLYRPVTMLWFVLLGCLDQDATIFNFGNVLLHFLVAVSRFALLMVLLEGVPQRRLVAVLVPLLALCHGVGAEAVVGIVGAAELLMALFLTLSWCSFTQASRGRGPLGGRFHFILSVLAFGLAVFSKENAVMFPLVLACQVFFFGREQGEDEVSPAWHVRLWRVSRAMFPFAGVLVAWALTRSAVLGSFMSFGNSNVYEGFTTLERISSGFASLGAVYLPKLLWPFGLLPNVTHQDLAPPGGLFDLRVLFGLALAIASLVGIAWAMRRRSMVALFLLFFVVTLFPTTNIVVPIGAIAAFRFLYSPMFGLVCAACLGVFALHRLKPLAGTWAGVALVVWGLLGAVGTERLIRNWKDQATLFRYTLEINPRSVWALQNDTWISWLTDSTRSTPQRLEATRRFDAIESGLVRIPSSGELDRDSQALCCMLLSNRALFCGRVAGGDEALNQESEECAARAEVYAKGEPQLEFKSQLLQAEIRLASYAALKGQPRKDLADRLGSLIDEAEHFLVRAEKLLSRSITKIDRGILYHNYFKIEILREHADMAEKYLAQAIEEDPTSPNTRMEAAHREARKGRYQEALEHLTMAMDDSRATVGLGMQAYETAVQMKDNELARRFLVMTARLRAGSPEELELRNKARKMLEGRF